VTDHAADIERIATLERELAEVTRQQAATVEVLEVIGDSAFDLARVFGAVIRSAVTLCRADAGQISAHVHATYPLAETPAAIKAIADRKVMGKVILHP